MSDELNLTPKLTLDPVSYTHLDVYKRQGLYSAHRHCGPNPGGQRGLEMHHLRLCGGEGNSARRLSVPYLPGQQRQICKTVKG